MNSVVHFELPAEDKQRMSNFYSQVFGWQTQQLGPEMGEYVVATTTEVDPETGFPKKPGSINGGFFTKGPGTEHPRIVIAVENIQDSMKQVTEAGGTLVQEAPDHIPHVGDYIAFIDTEGNKVALLQPIMPTTQKAD